MKVKPTATYPTSRWIARSQGRHEGFFLALGRPSAVIDDVTKAPPPSAIPLFLPRVGVVVVAACLPIARHVGFSEANPSKPLGALPKVEIRNEGADWRPMRARER